ncbi:MAG: hypothetical protein QM537_06115 [Candidatus Symbiobacter sp.]|nr:hypothetical protein [Candidatus Symbiobacter sp.]
MAEKKTVSSQAGGDEFFNEGQYTGRGILVGRAGRSVVMPDQPLPDYDSPSVVAYQGELRAESGRSVMALVSAPKFPARYDILNHMRGNITGVLRVADWGYASFPGESEPRLVIMVDRPGGPRVMTALTAQPPVIAEENLITAILRPIVTGLKDLATRNVSHRAIRPTNLFYADSTRRMVVLGECVSVPPAFDQPDSFETIESAMCAPIGRGSGGMPEDLYSLGVTILTLMIGRDPILDRTPQTLLEQKISMGSYTALVGKSRLPIPVMEALRGLLSDSERDRWTLSDLEMWMDGRRLSPKQPRMPIHASRPFTFHGQEYDTARGLAIAFANHHEQAAAAIRTKVLDGWVRRSLGDELRGNALQTAVSASSVNINGRNSEDRLVARACMALDPEAPIRFRGFGIHPDGISYALSASQDNSDLRRILGEIIHARLPGMWAGLQERPRAEDLRLAQILDRMPPIIDNVQPGFGLERVLYELNAAEPCHSPLFQGYFVWDAHGIIPALEAVASKPNRPNLTIDRHLAAFMATRMRRNNEDIIRIVMSSEAETRNMAILRLLAGVQEQLNIGPAPNLCQWLLGNLESVANGFRHPLRRERILARLKRVVSSGRLRDLLDVVDDTTERHADELEFHAAAEEYAHLKIAIAEHDVTVNERLYHAISFGEQVAAVIGGTLISVSLAVSIFIWLF